MIDKGDKSIAYLLVKATYRLPCCR